MLALDDKQMLTLIKEFLDISDNERISSEADLTNINCTRDTLSIELHFLTHKLKQNQEQIKKLESENFKLKSDLKLYMPLKPCKHSKDSLPNDASPRNITIDTHNLFKFGIQSDQATRYRDTSDEVMVPLKLKTLYDLVMQYSIKGNYAVAIPLCEQSLVDIIKSSGQCSNDYASMLHVLANVYRDIGDYKKSVCLMLEVLLIRENLPESSKRKVVEILNAISALYGLTYSWTDAATYSRRSIEIMRDIYAEDDINIAKQLESLALIYKNDNQVTNAIECLKEAVHVYNANEFCDLLDVTRVQTQLASCYLTQLRFDTSLDLYKDILATCYHRHLEELWGLDRPLWCIAEDQEFALTSDVCELKCHYADVRFRDGLDEPGLRDVLSNMAAIYRQKNMNKAAKFLETWPDRNIPAPTVPCQTSNCRFSIHCNDDLNIGNTLRRSRTISSSPSSNYLSPIIRSVRKTFGDNVTKRSSLSLPRKSTDIDVTIYESWSKHFIVKRTD